MSHSSENYPPASASAKDSASAHDHLSESAQRIQWLQSKLVNLKILIAVPMGLLMIIYFFTFAMLIDQGRLAALYFELFSTIAFIFAFIFLNRLGYWLLKKRYSKQREYSQILNQFDSDSFAKDAQQIADRLNA